MILTKVVTTATYFGVVKNNEVEMKNTYFRGLAQTGAFQVKKQAVSNNLFRLKTLEFWLRAISSRDVTRMPEEYLTRILELSSRELCERVVRELENRELEKSKKKK